MNALDAADVSFSRRPSYSSLELCSPFFCSSLLGANMSSFDDADVFGAQESWVWKDIVMFIVSVVGVPGGNYLLILDMQRQLQKKQQKQQQQAPQLAKLNHNNRFEVNQRNH